MLYEACMGVVPYAKHAQNLDELRENIESEDLILIPEEVYGPELVRPRASPSLAPSVGKLTPLVGAGSRRSARPRSFSRKLIAETSLVESLQIS